MTQKFDHFFDTYDRIVPPWFLDVFAAVIVAGFVGWIVSLVF
jgi:uncharacterized membrane protein